MPTLDVTLRLTFVTDPTEAELSAILTDLVTEAVATWSCDAPGGYDGPYLLKAEALHLPST